MPRVDIFPGTHNRQGKPYALRSVTVKIVSKPATFDFVLMHSRPSVSNRRAISFRADFSVAVQDFDLFRSLDVAHRIDERSHIAQLGHGIAFRQQFRRRQILRNLFVIRMREFPASGRGPLPSARRRPCPEIPAAPTGPLVDARSLQSGGQHARKFSSRFPIGSTVSDSPEFSVRFLRLREEICAVDLRSAAGLLRLERERLLPCGVIYGQHRAGILHACVIVKVIILAVVRRLRNLVARKQHWVWPVFVCAINSARRAAGSCGPPKSSMACQSVYCARAAAPRTQTQQRNNRQLLYGCQFSHGLCLCWKVAGTLKATKAAREAVEAH